MRVMSLAASLLRLSLLSFSLFSLTAFAASAESTFSFADFPSEQHSLELQSIDFNSHPDAKLFRTRLTQQLGSAPNYAGKYLVLSPGCGTNCQNNLIVNLSTGAVIDSLMSSFGTCYTSASQLLILNPYLNRHFGEELPEWAYVYYYRVHDDRLELLSKTKQSYSGECEQGQ